jgi:hypothetical protein
MRQKYQRRQTSGRFLLAGWRSRRNDDVIRGFFLKVAPLLSDPNGTCLSLNAGRVSVFCATRQALRSNTTPFSNECLTARPSGYSTPSPLALSRPHPHSLSQRGPHPLPSPAGRGEAGENPYFGRGEPKRATRALVHSGSGKNPGQILKYPHIFPPFTPPPQAPDAIARWRPVVATTDARTVVAVVHNRSR